MMNELNLNNTHTHTHTHLFAGAIIRYRARLGSISETNRKFSITFYIISIMCSLDPDLYCMQCIKLVTIFMIIIRINFSNQLLLWHVEFTLVLNNKEFYIILDLERGGSRL